MKEHSANKTFLFTSIPFPITDWVFWEADSESDLSMQNAASGAKHCARSWG